MPGSEGAPGAELVIFAALLAHSACIRNMGVGRLQIRAQGGSGLTSMKCLS